MPEIKSNVSFTQKCMNSLSIHEDQSVQVSRSIWAQTDKQVWCQCYDKSGISDLHVMGNILYTDE